VKLLDFGIAKLLRPELYSERAEATRSRTAADPDYASPEQARGRDHHHRERHLLAGVLLYEILTGHLPYRLSGYRCTSHAVIGEVDPRKPEHGDRRGREADAERMERHRSSPRIGQQDP